MVGPGREGRTGALLDRLAPYRSGSRERLHPLTLADSALLVIDMQRYFLDKNSHAFLEDAGDILDNVQKLVSSYRERDLRVVFTRHALRDGEDPGIMATWWGDTLRDGDSMADIVDQLRPAPEDLVIRKTRYDAFVGTGLEERLRSEGVKRLVLTGVMTHLCVESTARDAFMRDFEVFVVVDGTSAGDDGLHISSLKCLTDGFAIPVTTEEVLACGRE